ncbi:hypothetical protein J2739_005510 [Variovorax soli]|uniref:Uncharacterized protein n=1 Tax=Variovorax soli TaxID=376815 RepID=A0ABU1NMM6_9BURK|nr:hypothetical protein [Variovorax soli]
MLLDAVCIPYRLKEQPVIVAIVVWILDHGRKARCESFMSVFP